jgi:hypothetical protein
MGTIATCWQYTFGSSTKLRVIAVAVKCDGCACNERLVTSSERARARAKIGVTKTAFRYGSFMPAHAVVRRTVLAKD